MIDAAVAPAVPGLSHIVRYALLQARRELTEKARYALFFGAWPERGGGLWTGT